MSAFLLDSWSNEKKSNKIVRILKEEFPDVPIIVFHGIDDFNDIQNAAGASEVDGFKICYLYSLARSRIREIAHAYLDQAQLELDEDLVANKLIDDIDALNIHRTPLNCLLLLRQYERHFDDSPVNRTQMIGNVLFSLFRDFDQIPKYSVRPDLKDCEFALGYLCEWLIQSGKQTFTREEFISKISSYCSHRLIEIDVSLLFSFLATENIFVRRGFVFGFRHAYWLYYFTAQRMHHDGKFAEYILSNSRYTAFPEVIEFYTGIDRRRDDAISILARDLQRMDVEFLSRTGISSDFNPYANAFWKPTDEDVEKMHREVKDSVKESTLPSQVKDAIADGSYNRSKPYRQEITAFITESSVQQMIQAMKGAARALRNSDHVDPEQKFLLLQAVMRCWVRMCQILAVLSPVLAANRKAQFENMGFYLDESFSDLDDAKKTWQQVMTAVPDNVVSWFQMDLFSKKLAPLFKKLLAEDSCELSSLLILQLQVTQRPTGWESAVEKFIASSPKNSFYLYKVYGNLRYQFRYGYGSEYSRQQIRTLAATAVAKHSTGNKKPNSKLLAKVGKWFDKSIQEE